jgi:hypothetical protein
MGTDFRLLFDTIKDPRDLAEVLHLAIATNRQVDITGKSIRHDHKKVAGVIGSWKPGFKQNPQMAGVEYADDFFSKVSALKRQGYKIIGTTPNSGPSLFETDLSRGKQAIVFGTEVGGLSKKKMEVLDGIIRVPMQGGTRFYTLRTVVPVIVHEIMRQKGMLGKPKKKFRIRFPIFKFKRKPKIGRHK